MPSANPTAISWGTPILPQAAPIRGSPDTALCAQVPARQPAVCRRSASRVACAAQPQQQQGLTSALGAGLLAAALTLGTVQSAQAEDLFYSDANISGLTPCKDNKAFQKRQKNEVKALQKRLKQARSRPRARVPLSVGC